MTSELVAGMAALVAGDVDPVVLALRGDVVVIRVGDVVVKAHEPDADLDELSARMRLAGDVRLAGLLLSPLSVLPSVVQGRVVTVWPLGVPVPERDPETAPLEEAGRLLADLHRFGPSDFVGVQALSGAPYRMARTVAELRSAGLGGVAARVLRAFDTLPAVDAPAHLTLCHGDWHLGQMVQAAGGWRLIDVDDLGIGDPAWDLARPAALHAAGVLDPETWGRFLNAYLAAGGVAVSPGDPWAALDVPARALVVQMAARALLAAQRDGKVLDEAQEALVETCDRIVAAHPHMARG